MRATTAPMLAHDPALPNRNALLDQSTVAERLESVLRADGGEIERCELRRAKYRIGESLRVVYDVDVDGVRHTLSGRMSDATRSRSMFRSVAAAVDVGPFAGAFHDEQLATVWWIVPNDRKLRHLDALLAPPPSLRAQTRTPWSRSELVEYAPEHCATVRCLDDAGGVVAFAKSYRPGNGGGLAAHYRAVATGVAIDEATRTPRPLLWSDGFDALVLEPLDGRRWSDLARAEVPMLLAGLGSAVAAIHRLAPGPMRRFERLGLPRLVHSTQLIAAARPDAAALCARLADRLRRVAQGSVGPDVLLHGDLHPGNALLDGARVNLIDLDQSGVGPAVADLGSLAARLRYDDIVGDRTAGSGDELFAIFADTYGAVLPLPSARALRWHTAAALVAERAMRAVNRVHRDALPRLDEVLAAALDLLGEEPHDGL